MPLTLMSMHWYRRNTVLLLTYEYYNMNIQAYDHLHK